MEWLVPILDAVLGSLVRSGLMLITGFLLERHMVSKEIADQFVSDGVTHVIIAVPAILAIAWSIWAKVKGRARFLTALEAAPGTTEAQIKDKVDSGLGVSVKAGAVLLACVLAGAAALSTACGPKSYHTAVQADVALSQALFTLQDEEIAAHNAKLIDDQHHAQYKAVILKLLQAGDDLTLALKAWDPSKPAPANVGRAVSDVSNLLNDLNVMTPTASKVIFAAQTVLSVLRGAGVLPGDVHYVSQVDRQKLVREVSGAKRIVGGPFVVAQALSESLFALRGLFDFKGPSGKELLEHGQILLPAVLYGTSVLPMKASALRPDVVPGGIVWASRRDEPHGASAYVRSVQPALDRRRATGWNTGEQDPIASDAGVHLRLRQEPRRERRREQSEETASAEHALLRSRQLAIASPAFDHDSRQFSAFIRRPDLAQLVPFPLLDVHRSRPNDAIVAGRDLAIVCDGDAHLFCEQPRDSFGNNAPGGLQDRHAPLLHEQGHRDGLVADNADGSSGKTARLASNEVPGRVRAIAVDHLAPIVVRQHSVVHDHAIARFINSAAQAKRDFAALLMSDVDHASILHQAAAADDNGVAGAVELDREKPTSRNRRHVAIQVQPHTAPDRQMRDGLTHAHGLILLPAVA